MSIIYHNLVLAVVGTPRESSDPAPSQNNPALRPNKENLLLKSMAHILATGEDISAFIVFSSALMEPWLINPKLFLLSARDVEQSCNKGPNVTPSSRNYLKINY